MRRTTPRPGERSSHAPDTDPIDLRDLVRSIPPRPAAVNQPFAGGRRPDLPSAAVTMTVIGAPIPPDGATDPEPERRATLGPLGAVRDTVSYGWRTRWTPRRRRRFARTAAGITLMVAVVLVVVASASVLVG